MLYNGIYLNYDNLVDIASRLKTKIERIKTCYDEVKVEQKEIDGTTDTWQGEDQKIFYEAFEALTNKFDGNVDKLNEIYDFLCKIIDNYETRDKTTSNDIDANQSNLDM